MKSKKVKLFALVSACMLAGCATVVAACDFSFKSKELESVTIDTSEVQKVFTRGDEFTSDGLVVTAHYDDGSKAVLKSGYHVRGVEIDHVTTEETKAAGKDTVRVIYGEKEADYDVEIIQVDRLELDLEHVTRSFVQHEAFTYEGLGVYAVFSNGERVDLAALGEDAYQVSYEEGDPQDVTATAGTHTVTVSTVAPAFTNEKGEPLPEDDCDRVYTATYTVTVTDDTMTGIRVVHAPEKTEYFVGDTFEPEGIVVNGIYEHGEAALPADAALTYTSPSLDGGKFTAAGENVPITVKFGTFETTFSVTVKAVTVEEISVEDSPQKTEYYVGDTFGAEGLTVHVRYNNGTETTLTYPEAGLSLSAPEMSTAGKKDVTVTYSEQTATFSITVYNQLTGLLVTDSVEEYAKGDTFDKGTLTVKALFNDAADGDFVTDFTVKDAPEGVLEAREYTVTVEYTVDDAEHFNRGSAEKQYTFTVKLVKSLSNFNNYMLETVGEKVRLQFYLAYEGYTEEEMYAAVLLIGEREVERVRLGAVTLFYFELPADLDKGTHDLSVKMPDGQTFAVVFDPANFANTNPNSMELGDNVYTFGLSDENRMQLTVSAAERTVTIAEVDPAHGSITVKRGDAEIHSGDKVPVGTELTVEAKPAEGYAVDSVMAGSEKVELTGNKGSFTVNGDVTVTANFVREGSTSHTLTVNANEGGTYELAPQAGDEGYEKGTQVKLTVKPNPHYGYTIDITGAEYTNEGDVYTITVGESAVTVTIDFYERSFDRPHNAVVNSGEGLVFYAFTTGYTGSELKNITLLVGETEIANYEAGYAEDLSGDSGARVFRFHVQEVKTAGKFALRIKFSESDIYDLTLASDAGFELDNLSYLFSNEGGQCYLTVTDNSAPKEEGISVTPDTVKYTVGDTFKAEDFTVTYTSATGETSALSLGEDGYSVHLGAKDGAAVTEGYAFNEATELTLVFVYKDFEVSVNVTVSAKTEVTLQFAGTAFILHGDNDMRVALNVTESTGVTEDDWKASELLIGDKRMPFSEHAGIAVYYMVSSLKDFENGVYEVKLVLKGTTYEKPSVGIDTTLERYGKQYRMYIEGEKLLVAVSEPGGGDAEKEIKGYGGGDFFLHGLDAMRAVFNITCTGFSSADWEAATLLIDGKTMPFSEMAGSITAPAVYFWVTDLKDFTDGTYEVKLVVDGQEYAKPITSIDKTVKFAGKTFRMYTEGDKLLVSVTTA